jgi:hypothetical protein
MPQMARKPFMETTMGQPGGLRQVPQKRRFGAPNARMAMVNHF